MWLSVFLRCLANMIEGVVEWGCDSVKWTAIAFGGWKGKGP